MKILEVWCDRCRRSFCFVSICVNSTEAVQPFTAFVLFFFFFTSLFKETSSVLEMPSNLSEKGWQHEKYCTPSSHICCTLPARVNKEIIGGKELSSTLHGNNRATLSSCFQRQLKKTILFLQAVWSFFCSCCSFIFIHCDDIRAVRNVVAANQTFVSH